MKTYLITGGSGFVGSHIAVDLLLSGNHVVIIDSYINSNPGIEKILYKIGEDKNYSFKNNLFFFRGDIRDEAFLKNIFQERISLKKPIDAVVHCGGLKSISESILDPLKYWDSNIIGSITLFKVMNIFDCFKIVFSSSASIYGHSLSNSIDENSPINPLSPYGNTKSSIEKILNDLTKTPHSRWTIINLRYFNPVGAHKSGILGEEPVGKPNNLFPRICYVMMGFLKELIIYGNDYPTHDGTCIRDFIHIEDLSKAHELALKKLFVIGPGSYSINIGTGMGYSVLDVLKTFEKINNTSIPYVFKKRREGDSPILIAKTNFAKEFLVWKYKKNLHDMCLDTWKWHSFNKNNLRKINI